MKKMPITKSFTGYITYNHVEDSDNGAQTFTFTERDMSNIEKMDISTYAHDTNSTRAFFIKFKDKDDNYFFSAKDFHEIKNLIGYGALEHFSGDYEAAYNAGKFKAFDTGGYTGAWGPYGKIAMLHEKEIVLNANDTENFLASMDLLHRILEIIDLQAMSNQIGGLLTSPGFMNNNSNIIEQNVHIEASFPNATNHSEIEEAFNNLINTAS